MSRPSRGMSATSRDPEEYARATKAARVQREKAAGEIADRIREQVFELIVHGDLMGGRALVATRLRQVAEAERRGDKAALRAAVIELGVAAGAWLAALDYVPPSELTNGTSAVA